MRAKFWIIIISVIFIRCSGYQYVPSPVYVPLNEKKGELKANCSFTSAQIGYAFTDHLSVYATGFRRSGKSNFTTALAKENGEAYVRSDTSREIDLGFSYFRKQNGYNMEILFGGGYGNVQYHNLKDLFPDYKFDMKARKTNFYIQPDFGFKKGKYLELGGFIRFQYLNYYDISTKRQAQPGQLESYDNYFAGRSRANLYFAEPGVSFKIGNENVKFQVIAFPVLLLMKPELRVRNLNLDLGLHINLDMNNL